MDINGFPIGTSAETGRATAKIVTQRVPGTGVLLPVCSDVAPLLIGLAGDFHRTVEPLDEGSCWGYDYRQIRGSTRMSFHSAGIAIDLNAPRHPLGSRGTFTGEQAATCRALARTYGCRWGGDYVGRVDEMHFEVILSRADALELVTRQQHSSGTQSGGYPLPTGHVFRPNPTRRPDWHDGRDGSDRDPIRIIQRTVGTDADGLFGPLTEAAVRGWQVSRGLVADGVVGPISWMSLAVVDRVSGERRT